MPISFPTPAVTPDAQITHRGHSYSISSVWFAKYCATYRAILPDLRTDPTQSFEITEQVSEQSIADFVNICQLQPFNLTTDNALDLYLLACSLGAATVQKAILETINGHHSQLLIGATRIALRFAQPESRDWLQIIKQNLPLYIEDPGFFALPLKELVSILDFASGANDPGKLFPSLLRGVDELGPLGSILFQGADFSLLSAGQMRALLDRSDFGWSLLVGELEKGEAAVDRLLADQSAQIAALA
jgi:hypothetical protein